jgi:hypothetical protein
MPGLQRRSPLKGLNWGNAGQLFCTDTSVIPSRREESPPRTPNVVLREHPERCFSAAQHDRGGCAGSANVRSLSPFSGLRLWSPGIYPRAGPGRRHARGHATHSPSGAGATPRSGSYDPYPPGRGGRSERPTCGTAVPPGGAGAATRSGSCDPFPGRGSSEDEDIDVQRPSGRTAIGRQDIGVWSVIKEGNR